jgi:peroxisomal 3,2-trans-enoyl-CoA isomerase
LTGWADFIYAAPHTFLLTPFSSLGLVAEGGASVGFVQRMGLSKANEALIMSKRLSCEELLQCGYINKVFDTKPTEQEKFLELVLKEVDDRLGKIVLLLIPWCRRWIIVAASNLVLCIIVRRRRRKQPSPT